MEAKIKEVQDYFRAKLLAGDFVHTRIEESFMVVTIDEVYDFCIWTNTKITCQQWTAIHSFMLLPPFTKEESLILWENLHIIRQLHLQEIKAKRISEIEDELKKLKL